MISQELTSHVEYLALQMNMPEEGKRFVMEALRGEPVRDVKHAAFFSRKMGRHIFVESTAGELAEAILCEQDPEVVAYFPQPGAVTVDYRGAEGTRCTTRPYRPDFLKITKKDIRVIEVRDEARLFQLTVKHPRQYVRDDLGRYRFIAGEEAFATMGLPYEVISNSSMPHQLLNNCQFLRDYYRIDTQPLDSDSAGKLRSLVAERHAVPYMEIINEYGLNADQVMVAIVEGVVYVDLRVERLDTPSDLVICADIESARAYRLARQRELQPMLPLPGVMKLRPGTKVKFDGKEFIVMVSGETEIIVRDEDGHCLPLPLESVIELNNLGCIETDSGPTPVSTRQTLDHYDSDQFSRAHGRWEAVKNWDLDEYSRSSLQEFKRKIRGVSNPFDAISCLMDSVANRGDRTPRFLGKENDFMITALKAYNTPQRPTKVAAFGLYVALRSEHQKKTGERIQIRSYQSFCKKCDQKEDILKREGAKALYQKKPIDVFLYLLFPVHGSRPHEVCYIDHTPAVIATSDLDGVMLGKPTLSVGIDGATRQRRALWLSYNAPSAATVLLVLRDYVRRHGRVPDVLVVDNGKEFHSNELIVFCTILGIDLRFRKPREPRGGAVVERSLGATEEEVLQQLEGNTTFMKDPRLVSKNVNPFDRAVWTLTALYGSLDEYFRQYNGRAHPALGMSPNEREAALFRTAGRREHTLVRFDENLMLFTCPHTKKFFHKVDTRRGIQHFGKFYWHPEFRSLKEGTKLEVRVEPWCAIVLYVCMKRKWVVAVCRDLSAYRGRTSKEVELALRERDRAAQRAGKYALMSEESLKRKVILSCPAVFDSRIASQQREMSYMASLLGMDLASKEARRVLERIEASSTGSPFIAASDTDVDVSAPTAGAADNLVPEEIDESVGLYGVTPDGLAAYI